MSKDEAKTLFECSKRHGKKWYTDPIGTQYLAGESVSVSNRISPEYSHLGRCTCVCRHCGAMFWECEKIASASHTSEFGLQQMLPYGGRILYTMEFQKRGLPHCHSLLWISDKSKVREDVDVDKYVCAELPDPTTDPNTYTVISELMIHGPCGSANQGKQSSSMIQQNLDLVVVVAQTVEVEVVQTDTLDVVAQPITALQSVRKACIQEENRASSYTSLAIPAPRVAPRTAKWNLPTYSDYIRTFLTLVSGLETNYGIEKVAITHVPCGILEM
ncbi:hypothetical protein Tco_0719113 [Tanacetum coccineum]